MGNKKLLTIKVLIFILASLMILNILVSFFSSIRKDTTEIFNENISKVVEIKVSDDEQNWGYATGCFIDNNGTILTNKHVVLNSSNMNYTFIKIRDAKSIDWCDAAVLKVSEDYDLATIKIEKKNTEYFSISDIVKNGETIFTIGNPSGFGLSFSEGVVSSSNRNVIYNDQIIAAIQTSLVINEGNSGGPIFNEKGKLLGIISFRLRDSKGEVIQGVSFAIPQKTIKDFLK